MSAPGVPRTLEAKALDMARTYIDHGEDCPASITDEDGLHDVLCEYVASVAACARSLVAFAREHAAELHRDRIADARDEATVVNGQWAARIAALESTLAGSQAGCLELQHDVMRLEAELAEWRAASQAALDWWEPYAEALAEGGGDLGQDERDALDRVRTLLSRRSHGTAPAPGTRQGCGRKLMFGGLRCGEPGGGGLMLCDVCRSMPETGKDGT